MTKKITTISIEENILKKAKKEIPNLSIWVEDGLKAYFGVNDTDLMVIDENRQNIRDSMLKIHLASKKNNNVNEEVQFNETELNNAWSKLWRKYRNGQEITSTDLINANNILQVGVNELKNLMETLEITVDRADMVKCDKWNYVIQYL